MERIESTWKADVKTRVESFKKELGREGQWLRWIALLDQTLGYKAILSELKKRYQTLNVREKVIAGNTLKELDEQIRKRISEMYRIDRTLQGEISGISQEDIDHARTVDVRVLFDTARDKVLCPFHNDHHPSATVKGGFFHCFTCNTTHDAIGICMNRDGMTFKQAVEFLKGY